MELVEDPRTDVLAEDTILGLGLWKIVDIISSSVDVVKSLVQMFSSGGVKTVAFD